MDSMQIRPLESGDLSEAAKILSQLNGETPREVIAGRLATLLNDHPHYLLIGAFTGDTLAGVAGAWIATKIWCGRYLEIDNLIVDQAARAQGIGSKLIRHLEGMAVERDCNILVLDSYTANHASHRLYQRLGFEIWSFHFIKPIGDWKGNGTPA
jgi:ribosomal protein S18 acetylase RimI-like enzyme